MRIKQLSVQGFRAFPDRVTVNMDADIVLIAGRNGTGKTSLFDAITWAISGSVPRIAHQESLVSLYSESGSARVSLDLVDDDKALTIERFSDGTRTASRLTENGKTLDGDAAALRLLDLFWPSSESTEIRESSLAVGLTRSIYLQQDLLKQFISADTAADRFKVLSELLGAGRIVDLQQALEQARNAFTRAVLTPLEGEIGTLNQRFQQLSSRISQVRPPMELAQLQAAVSEWSAEVTRTLPDDLRLETSHPIVTQGQVEVLLGALSAFTMELRRGRVDGEAATAELRRLQELPDIEYTLTEKEQLLKAHDAELTNLKHSFELAQQEEISRRGVFARSLESRGELRELARLALKHLGQHCPVCAQEYNQVATRKRLELLTGEKVDQVQFEGTAALILDQINNLERAANAARLDIIKTRESAAYRAQLFDLLNERLAKLQVVGGRDLPTIEERIDDYLSSNAEMASKAARLVDIGENLLQSFGLIVEGNQRQSMQKQLDEARLALMEAKTRHERGQNKYEAATTLINALRRASQLFVEDRIERLAPLLNRLYARISPHPSFDLISIVSHMERGRGRLETHLTDTENEKTILEPNDYLSSSQISALAVVVFLGLNLSTALLPLNVAMLDDPLQSLDDINLLGVIDVLRRIRGKRQLFLSTHESRLAELLQRKLRPTQEEQKTIRIDIDHLSKTQVEVFSSDSNFEGPALRVVA